MTLRPRTTRPHPSEISPRSVSFSLRPRDRLFPAFAAHLEQALWPLAPQRGESDLELSVVRDGQVVTSVAFVLDRGVLSAEAVAALHARMRPSDTVVACLVPALKPGRSVQTHQSFEA